MTIAIALETIMPGASYSGSLTSDTPEAYAAITWLDTRPKPPFDKVMAANTSVVKSALKAYAADLRYQRQIGGYTYRGQMYRVDAQSVAALTMAYSLAKANASYNTQWKMADGSFLPMNAANIISLYGVITGFIQALFNAEAVVDTSIDVGSVKTREQVFAAIYAVPNAS